MKEIDRFILCLVVWTMAFGLLILAASNAFADPMRVYVRHDHPERVNHYELYATADRSLVGMVGRYGGVIDLEPGIEVRIRAVGVDGQEAPLTPRITVTEPGKGVALMAAFATVAIVARWRQPRAG